MDDEQEKIKTEELPSSVEEMRLKRLAYFSSEKSQAQTKEWKIDHPSPACLPSQNESINTQIDPDVVDNYYTEDHSHKQETDLSSKQKGNYNQCSHSTNQSASNCSMSPLNTNYFNMQYSPSVPVPPLFSSQLPDQSQRHAEISENGPVPLKSKRMTSSHNSYSLSNSMGHISLSDSNDIDKMSVFKSKASLDDLGLSTHRPESETSARSIQGEIYIPSNQGSGKTTKQIFSHKTQEVLHSALGDEKMEELMNKVSHDIVELKQGRNQAPLPMGSQFYEMTHGNSHDKATGQSLARQLSQDSLHENHRKDNLNNRFGRYENPSPRRHSFTQSNASPQDGMKEFRSLIVQNHDQITLPKSARNSFSSEEIYRQAYGDGMMFERNSRGFSSPNTSGPMRHPNRMNDPPTSQNDGQHPLGSARLSMMDYPTHQAMRHPPYQGYHNPFSYPPPSVPTPPFDHHHPPPNTGVSVSPQSTYGGNGFPFFMQPPPYSGHSNPPHHPHPYFHDMPNSSPQYGQLYGPPHSQVRTSGTPPSPGMYTYNHSFSSHYGSPRFSGHPGIHPGFSAAQQQHAFDQQQVGKSSFNPYSQIPHGLDKNLDHAISQNSPRVKIPHPPSIPPAVQGKDDSPGTKSKPAFDHRRVAIPSTQPAGSTSGEEFKSFNLQRYFSSMELHTNDSDQVSAPVPQSSRSVEGDYYKHEAEDDTATTFTSVTGVTSASKAAGLTSRLADLGVNMDHLKHLKLVDGSKIDGENQEISFDAYAKSIRRCPECNTANKAYMDWCVDCGEVLIGVELSLPRGKKKQSRNNSNDNNNSKKSRSRSRSGTREGRSMGNLTNFDRLIRRDSPESGKGISLSSSPARHNKMEMEEAVETKDSGRASNCEVKDQYLELRFKTDDEEKEEENIDEEQEVYDDDDVEYVYEDVESDIFEQISDPILRDFIISYRNRQVSNQNSVLDNNVDNPQCDIQQLHGENQHHLGNDHVHGIESDNQGENYNDLDNHDMANQGSQKQDVLEYRSKTEESWRKSKTSVEAPIPSVGAPDVKKKSKRKKKKPGSEAIDIEIFGYEESRQSRSSSCNIVPALNLVRSSEEEETDDDDDDEDDDKVNEDFNVKSSMSTSSSSTSKVTGTETYQNVQSRQKDKSQAQPRHPQPLPSKSLAPSQSSKSGPGHSQSKSRTKSREDNPASASASYQRHWARSSIAWSSYNPRELNTRSSLSNLPNEKSGERPTSARATINKDKTSERQWGGNNPATRQRPSSADYDRRKPVFSQAHNTRPSSAKTRNDNPAAAGRNPVPVPRHNNYVSPGAGHKPREQSPVVHHRNSNKDPSSHAASPQPLSTQPQEMVSSGQRSGQNAREESSKEDESLKILCPEFHRLPPDHEEDTADKMHAVAKIGYDRFHELTPRIQDGALSLWQCLPDEVWLFILNFLPQSDLCRLMQVSKGFYRLANDESLWRYITVRPHFALTDTTLASIMSHHPVSLAMVKCQGHDLSSNALQDFFKETKGRLKELNICGCSHGALVGSVVLNMASKFCHSLTHLDASFCNINDASFTAIVSHCDRLESVCINGFQAMSDSALLTLVKKHGTSLRTLELYACFSLTASVLRNLGEYCNNLRRLCLGGCNKLTASTMITLSTNLSRVEELDLRGCRNLKNECIRKIVRNCPRIQTLILANCQQISNPALVEMGTYLKHTLRIVDVCGCNLVEDQGIISLVRNCDRLTLLDISSTSCTQNSVNAIASSNCSRWIESVKLSFLSGISEASVTNLLRHCPRLKLIHAFGCSSLRNLSRLRDIRPDVTIEGDVEVPRQTFQ